jgi:glycosyltransferase involved in cell wall biosynthesis
LVKEPITYMSITVPNLDKLKRNLPIVLPHVDEAVIVIGRESPETLEYLSRFSQVRPVFRSWTDSFRAQYQAGLDQIKGGWVNIMDDDEIPSEDMLRSFPELIERSQNGRVFDVVEFQAIEVRQNGDYHRTDYYRQMFYRWNPNLRYEIELHQALVGLMRGARCQAPYYHVKKEGASLKGACRDFFIAGVWADHKESFEYWHKETGQDPRVNSSAPLVPQPQGLPYPLKDGFRIDTWYEMKDILARNHPEVQYYHDLDLLIRNGTVCREFVQWAERHNQENDKRPHLHELHAFDRYIKQFSH